MATSVTVLLATLLAAAHAEDMVSAPPRRLREAPQPKQSPDAPPPVPLYSYTRGAGVFGSIHSLADIAGQLSDNATDNATPPHKVFSTDISRS